MLKELVSTGWIIGGLKTSGHLRGPLHKQIKHVDTFVCILQTGKCQIFFTELCFPFLTLKGLDRSGLAIEANSYELVELYNFNR